MAGGSFSEGTWAWQGKWQCFCSTSATRSCFQPDRSRAQCKKSAQWQTMPGDSIIILHLACNLRTFKDLAHGSCQCESRSNCIYYAMYSHVYLPHFADWPAHPESVCEGRIGWWRSGCSGDSSGYFCCMLRCLPSLEIRWDLLCQPHPLAASMHHFLLDVALKFSMIKHVSERTERIQCFAGTDWTLRSNLTLHGWLRQFCAFEQRCMVVLYVLHAHVGLVFVQSQNLKMTQQWQPTFSVRFLTASILRSPKLETRLFWFLPEIGKIWRHFSLSFILPLWLNLSSVLWGLFLIPRAWPSLFLKAPDQCLDSIPFKTLRPGGEDFLELPHAFFHFVLWSSGGKAAWDINISVLLWIMDTFSGRIVA